MNKEATKYLLDKLGIIAFKYQKINEQNQDRFNIFSILRNYSDEVNLHSKFISELLNKNGTHGKGAGFCEAFLKELDISFDLENYSVQREYKNIDVLLRDKNGKAIIIENKIWAKDQHEQLKRYHEQMLKEGYQDQDINIVYLSLHGEEPDKSSLGDLKEDKIILLSYEHDIYNWIECCIEISARIPGLRETLIQYQKIINQLTGRTMNENEEQTQEVIKLLSENDNMINAQLIADNWVHVRWHTEWDFWNDFSELISKDYEIIDCQKFSPWYLDSAIHRKKNRDPYYGIMFKIGELKGADMCLYIERGDWNLYYGITMMDKSDRTINAESRFDEFRQLLTEKELDKWWSDEWWLFRKLLEPEINFNSFSGSNTLRLANEQHRKEYIAKIWEEIQELVRFCQDKLKNIENIVCPKGIPSGNHD